MIAEAVFVGTELLLGQIVNTNAAYLGQRLSELGIDHYSQTVVGDNARRLTETLAMAIKRADVVITSGGLGPTMDDITRETVAELTHRELEFNPDIWEGLRRLRPNAPENMKRQALVPAGATILPNDNGTAPGLAVPTADDKLFILLPGPPAELRPMFGNYAIPLLLARMGERTTLVSRSLHFCEIGESPLEDRLKDLIAAQVDPTMATYAKPGDVQLRISTKANSREEGLARIAPLEAEIRRRVGEYIYGTDNTTLEQAIGELLQNLGWKATVIDTATGGAVTSRLTTPVGAEAWFATGVVTTDVAPAWQLLRQAGYSLPELVNQDATQAAMALAEAGISGHPDTVCLALVTATDGLAAAVATPCGRRSTTINGWRGNPVDLRWRQSQSVLAFLRRFLIEIAPKER